MRNNMCGTATWLVAVLMARGHRTTGQDGHTLIESWNTPFFSTDYGVQCSKLYKDFIPDIQMAFSQLQNPNGAYWLQNLLGQVISWLMTTAITQVHNAKESPGIAKWSSPIPQLNSINQRHVTKQMASKLLTTNSNQREPSRDSQPATEDPTDWVIPT